GDSVVLETGPGSTEAVVLAPGAPGIARMNEGAAGGPDGTADSPAVRDAIDAAVRDANRTLSQHQRLAAWRLWPGDDFPRTHTLKVRRDEVRKGADVDVALPVRQVVCSCGGTSTHG